MEQMAKERQRAAQNDVQDAPEAPQGDAEAQAASAEAADLLAELDALLDENDAVVEEAEEAQEDLLSRWDKEADLVDAMANPDWELADDASWKRCVC